MLLFFLDASPPPTKQIFLMLETSHNCEPGELKRETKGREVNNHQPNAYISPLCTESHFHAHTAVSEACSTKYWKDHYKGTWQCADMRFFRKDADLGERTEGKGYLMTNPKQAHADSKVTNWQYLEKDVWRTTVCLASTTTVPLWRGQRSLQTCIEFNDGKGRKRKKTS